MNVFKLHLFATDRYELIEGVTSFTGEDGSGSFGVQARHERCMTTLTFGLARLLLADGRREYLGLPGGLLYFVDNEMRISTRRYLRGDDATAIAGALARELLEVEQALEQTRRKLHRLEAEMVRHVAQLGLE